MPELPEVETMRRGLAGIVGMRVGNVEIPCGRLRPIAMVPPRAVLSKRLQGTVIEAAERFGKRIAFRLHRNWQPQAGNAVQWLVIEPRMTGLLLVADPPTQEHVRLRLSECGSSKRLRELIFWDRRGLGTLRLVDADGLAGLCGPDRLGPDALRISCDELVERLGRSARPIKVALLDQKAVAGIGNLYAAEILFLARINPQTRCLRLSRPRWQRLHAVLQEVLEEAVELEGSTLSDATYRTALNEPGRYQARHRVYGRQGMACPACSTTIRRIVQAQRSTFYCPRCQLR